jgi:putative membrane protein
MMYYGHGMGAGWSMMVLLVVLPTLLLAMALIYGQLRHQPADRPGPVPDAERVLAGRFARGEIDAEEYEQRLRTLAGR